MHVFAGDDAGLQTLRHQIAVGAGAKATILMTFAGPDGVAYDTNVVTELQVGDGAHLRLVTAQEEGDEAMHLALLLPRLGGKVRFEPFGYNTGGRVARSEIRMAFEAEHSTVGMRGATLGTRQAAHGHDARGEPSGGELRRPGIFQVGHGRRVAGRVPGQDHRGAGRAEDRFQDDEPRAAPVRIRPSFSNKPELEIFADDVVCGHGATCGRIDEQMLFFLRSRGIGKEEAERMLVLAFLAEAIEMIGDEAIEEALEARVRRSLGMEEMSF